MICTFLAILRNASLLYITVWSFNYCSNQNNVEQLSNYFINIIKLNALSSVWLDWGCHDFSKSLQAKVNVIFERKQQISLKHSKGVLHLSDHYVSRTLSSRLPWIQNSCGTEIKSMTCETCSSVFSFSPFFGVPSAAASVAAMIWYLPVYNHITPAWFLVSHSHLTIGH